MITTKERILTAYIKIVLECKPASNVMEFVLYTERLKFSQPESITFSHAVSVVLDEGYTVFN